MDILVALISLVLLSPLMVVVVASVWLTMGRPIVFGHHRIGYNGRPFRCYKFRTMVANAEETLAQHIEHDDRAAREWSETRKLRNDPRVTFLGHMLRKSSIDEIPQLINVLRGEMSCVGPRPIVAEEAPLYGPYLQEYMKARPGMTGAWQVSGRNRVNYRQRVALDCDYVHNWSSWLDLLILMKTVFVVSKFDDAS